MAVYVQNGFKCVAHGGVADWELWLTAAAQPRLRALYCILLPSERSKITIQNVVATER